MGSREQPEAEQSKIGWSYLHQQTQASRTLITRVARCAPCDNDYHARCYHHQPSLRHWARKWYYEQMCPVAPCAESLALMIVFKSSSSVVIYLLINQVSGDCQDTSCNPRMVGVLCIITVWTVVQTMLTATFNSYGNRQISPRTKSIPLNRSTKKSAQLTTPARGPPIPNLVEINSLGASGQMDEIWQKLFLFIYLYLFFFDQFTGQIRGWIFTRDSSKDVKSRKDVPFWGYKTFDRKCLTIEALKSKLNHHCSPIKVA